MLGRLLLVSIFWACLSGQAWGFTATSTAANFDGANDRLDVTFQLLDVDLEDWENNNFGEWSSFITGLYFEIQNESGTTEHVDTENADALYYYEEGSQLDDVPEDNGTQTTVTFSVTFRGKNGNEIQDLLEDNDDISIEVFLKFGDAEASSAEVVVTEQSFIIKEAPTLESDQVTPGNEQLKVTWDTNPGAVQVLPDTATDQVPSGVRVFLINQDEANFTDLATKNFVSGEDDETVTEGGCTFDSSKVDDDNCITCTTETHYLDIASGLPSAIRPSTIQTLSRGEFTYNTGIVNDKNYIVFLRYETNGAAHSKCQLVAPEDDTSSSEANGADEAKSVNFRCFIATATYGSMDHPDVVLFRNFRDNVLLHLPFGRIMVDFYYKHSPGAADWLEGSPKAKAISKVILESFADGLRYFQGNGVVESN